jgi:hypothetical protein
VRKRATPAQIALAWLLAQKPRIVPIPGTTELCFLKAIDPLPQELCTFCRLPSYNDAHISEVLALTPVRIDVTARLVIVESLKKRPRGIFRAVPSPSPCSTSLSTSITSHDFTFHQNLSGSRIWPW